MNRGDAEGTENDTEMTEEYLEKRQKLGLSWLSSLLVDFGTFAVVARDSFRGPRPKVLAHREPWTTRILRTDDFPRITRKDHATLATTAKTDAKETEGFVDATRRLKGS